MVDMAKVHGLEEARAEVLKAWKNNSAELHELTGKVSEACERSMNAKYQSEEWHKAEHDMKTWHEAWNQSYGMSQMCGQLYDRLSDMIHAEYQIDEEAV